MRCTSHVRNARCLITRRRITVLESQTHDTVGIFILPERMNIYAGSTRWLEPMFPMILCHDAMARCALQFRRLGSQDERRHWRGKLEAMLRNIRYSHVAPFRFLFSRLPFLIFRAFHRSALLFRAASLESLYIRVHV